MNGGPTACRRPAAITGYDRAPGRAGKTWQTGPSASGWGYRVSSRGRLLGAAPISSAMRSVRQCAGGLQLRLHRLISGRSPATNLACHSQPPTPSRCRCGSPQQPAPYSCPAQRRREPDAITSRRDTFDIIVCSVIRLCRRYRSVIARRPSPGAYHSSTPQSSTTSILKHGSPTILCRIADHPAKHIAELMPWNWKPLSRAAAA